jgi:hypothetical protein
LFAFGAFEFSRGIVFKLIEHEDGSRFSELLSCVCDAEEFDAVHRLLDFVKSVPLVMGDRKQTALYF